MSGISIFKLSRNKDKLFIKKLRDKSIRMKSTLLRSLLRYIRPPEPSPRIRKRGMIQCVGSRVWTRTMQLFGDSLRARYGSRGALGDAAARSPRKPSLSISPVASWPRSIDQNSVSGTYSSSLVYQSRLRTAQDSRRECSGGCRKSLNYITATFQTRLGAILRVVARHYDMSLS